MKVKPLNDWAVIIPDEAEARTAGGLYIPDAAKDKPAEGVVEAIGPGAYEEERPGERKERGKKKERKFIPTSVKPGDHVVYERYAGQRIAVGPQERVLVRERSILGYLPTRPRTAEADPPPLHFPLTTVKAGERSLMKRGGTAVALAHQHTSGALKPEAGKAARKAGKKAAKKAAKKAGKKAAKKAGKKAGKKPAKKAAKKAAKKLVRRASAKGAAARKKASVKKAKKKR
jgi:co-chaperonin GroES (HSP10)